MSSGNKTNVSTAMVDFLFNAYKIPDSARVMLLEKHNSLEDRLDESILYLYIWYLHMYKGRPLKELKDLKFDDNIMNEIMAGAVWRNFTK